MQISSFSHIPIYIRTGFIPSPFRGSWAVTALCINSNHSNHWADSETYQIIECKPGCVNDKDCLGHQHCQQNKCVSRECKTDVMNYGYLKVQGGSRVNSEGEFNCPLGHVYHEGEEVSISVEVVCEMQYPVPRWVTKATMQILKPCEPGTY